MISLVITSIEPAAPLMWRNIKMFQELSLDVYVILDRQVEGLYPPPFINYRDPPDNEFERMCTFDSYSRKNIGYILAAKRNSNVLETDDDNLINAPLNFLNIDFETPRPATEYVDTPNLFRDIYPDAIGCIWARGLPLEKRVNSQIISKVHEAKVGVVQFLVKGEPDVDAIYRLVLCDTSNIDINPDHMPINLMNTFHPFNSQATYWPSKNLCLAYLPFTCSFRMTDIYRSFISQKILYSHGESVLFDHAVFTQQRNPHNIVGDFKSEWLGYVHVEKILAAVETVNFGSKQDMLYECYRKLTNLDVFQKVEMATLEAYLKEVNPAH